MSEEECFALIQYLFNADGPNEFTKLCAEKDDPLSVRVVAIHLLEWLKYMHGSDPFRPLEVNVDVESGADIRALVLGVPVLQQFFVFKVREVWFRDEVPYETRSELCRKADDFFKPLLMR